MLTFFTFMRSISNAHVFEVLLPQPSDSNSCSLILNLFAFELNFTVIFSLSYEQIEHSYRAHTSGDQSL